MIDIFSLLKIFFGLHLKIKKKEKCVVVVQRGDNCKCTSLSKPYKKHQFQPYVIM